MSIFAWLAVAVGPLAKRVLLALGIGWVSYSLFTAAVETVYTAVLANWGGITGSVLQLLQLFGAGEAIAITLGALTTRAAILAVPKLGKLLAGGT